MTRIAVVDKSRCNPKGCGNYLCIRMCPVNRTGSECIIESEDKKIIINEDLCNGCNICVRRCPFKAISIINLPEKLKSEPLHRFGKNGFCLFGMPVPKKGKVVGILGRNGIGKSTAIQILSGLITPNLGKDNDNYDEIIKFFKGNELQKYFTDLKNKKIKVSYKTQKVSEIVRQFKGKKVIELLKPINENGKLDEFIKELEMENIINNKVETLSGGELQKLAVIAASLKKANIYYFDEPSSYLDIKQRLKVAKFIRNLANENVSVVVIEHDLIILDYMADLIHILYGQPSGYGVVSQPLASKLGINSYLDGYLRSENIRFRDKRIHFDIKSHLKKKAGNELFSWPEFTKELGRFKLESKSSSVSENEVIGILGQNGIGKTTFVEVLAGVEKPTTGKIDNRLKIAYKPQYIEENDQIVEKVLSKAISKYKNQIITPLEIEPFMKKKLNELSGGELQRVAIALCLSQDADIYLLDEPSAYLDIEQRLIISKVINDLMEERDKSALVVDHDLLFVDYLSKRIFVFDGVPAIKGYVDEPLTMEKGMNKLLQGLEITIRREEHNNRPRINKLGSVKDREQKKSGKYYYT